MNFRLVKRDDTPVDLTETEKLSKKLDLHPKIAELLFSRGLRDESAIKRFLSPDQADLHDPFLMKGMSAAAQRVNQAITNGETVIVYGDYDADGVCAAAILTLYLVSRGLKVYPHIPSRTGEGYGLAIDSLERIIDEAEPDLIITCDCGISGKAEVAHTLDLGVDIIVTDHHEVSGEIPECVVVNPKQADCNYPVKNLCDAGVALKLVEALGGRDAAMQYVDLAAVATVADLVPLLGENRLIVQLGLMEANRRSPGLKALYRNLDLTAPTSGDIAYKIAPRINAAGRMGDAYRAFELLTTTDQGRIAAIISEINADNQRRKTLSDEMYQEAIEDIKSEDLVSGRAVVLSHPSWEKGITGILAARIAGDFKRPAFIMVDSGTHYKGTCRSFGAINIYELLSSVSDLLIEFGGHSQAAGFSIEKDNIAEFKRRANVFLERVPDEEFLPSVEYDVEIDESDINLALVKALELMEPVGNSNVRPVFKLTSSGLNVALCKNNYRHTALTTRDGLGILAFNHYNQNQFLLGDDPKQLALELSVSLFGKKESVKAVLKGVIPEKLYINDEVARANYLKNVSIKKTGEPAAETYSPEKLHKFLDGNIYGTLLIAGCADTYRNFIEKHSPKYLYHEFMYSTVANNLTRIGVSPIFDAELDLSNYEKIVFLDSPVGDGLVPYINRRTKARVYVPAQNNETEFLKGLELSRASFGRYYEILRGSAGLSSLNLFSYAAALKKAHPDITVQGLIAALSVFGELRLISFAKDGFSVSVKSGAKVELGESAVYRYLTEKAGGNS